jgi:DNA-directed RNA polymerase III subunit RPC8
VLADVGLCVCVFDIAEAGEGKVRYGDGFLWYSGQWLLCDFGGASAEPRRVTFRLVVFRPFTSEVILAKVKSSDEDGIRRELYILL